MDQPQTFRSPIAVVIWVAWLLFAVANWIDLAVQGRDRTSAVAAATLLLGTGIAYVTAQRPRLIADAAGLTVRNPLRDHRIGWPAVVKAELRDLVRVHCTWDGHSRVITAWAVQHSRRRQFAAEVRARRAAARRFSIDLPPGGGQAYGGVRGPAYGGVRGSAYAAAGRGATPARSAAEADAELIVRVLNEHAAAARAAAQQGTQPAAGPAAGPPRSTWSGRAIAALVVPALILLIVWLA
ncbi:MAG: PH domain-containing protein [Actinobacteria bacterium]|nr:PH domain-containing protein [Actinomycetota bacterium]